MFLQILTLLGSLGMFLYGMSLMSGGLQKMAGLTQRLHNTGALPQTPPDGDF